MDIQAYLDEVRKIYATGDASEQSYRPALARLFASIDPAIIVLNEAKGTDAGTPDFLFKRGDVPIGWCEAKNVDKDVIRLKGYSIDQRKRYERAFPNLIYTNAVDFEFIREGAQVHFVSIADFLMGLQPNPDRFDELARQLRLFAEQTPVSIRSAAKLAEMMAAKAAIIKDEVDLALKDDPQFRSDLGGQFQSFKANLLPALEPDEFADIYAETITYGLFAARFHDDDLTTFSRQEALERLPASNPFLKGLFRYIAGTNLPRRLEYIVDDLVEVMRASDPHSLFENYGKFTARNDPFVHFYEDFLAAYNPKKRKSRGVWYTPEPVVDFIVRAVDDVLKTEFGLAQGLADTSKVTVDWDTGQTDPKTGKAVTVRKDVHKVQILDPATGTGTFLAKAVQLIGDRVKKGAPGKWSGYVEQDLLPRLHGFELLMASYAMCHMKLDMQLTQSGYQPSANSPRLSVWLTNALEPADRVVQELFFKPLAEEARGASDVKRQTPIMCVIGNPPYSGESANKGAIPNLMADYKKEPGGKKPLAEHQTRWLQDDYVKFIRMAEDVIARNPSGGVLGFITNHGYLDNPTFRGMRWHLLKTFDRLIVIDLHGSSKKSEVAPDGGPDENVFDILPGVALIVGVRNPKAARAIAELSVGNLWGNRSAKYEALWASSATQLVSPWEPREPSYSFQVRDHSVESNYLAGFSIKELMPQNSAGTLSARDGLTVDMDRTNLWERMNELALSDVEDFRAHHSVGKDSKSWSLSAAQSDVRLHLSDDFLRPIQYRPFDKRWTFYTGTQGGIYFFPAPSVMPHVIGHPNLAIGFTRKIEGTRIFADVLAFDQLITHHSLSLKEVNYLAPLYLYPEEGTLDRAVRLNVEPKLYAAICKAAVIDPADQGGPDDDFRAATGDARPSEVKVFDYIYGVLHSPTYRETFAEFLKIDFPHIPYPLSPEVFRHVGEKGEQLRRLHLMEAAAIGETPCPYLGDGDDVVAPGYPKFADGKVNINAGQYFDAVPRVAWDFYIGGYQPAQKWLKDRRGRSLSYDDIGHYQKIIKILAETDRIMKEIKLPLG